MHDDLTDFILTCSNIRTCFVLLIIDAMFLAAMHFVVSLYMFQVTKITHLKCVSESFFLEKHRVGLKVQRINSHILLRW